MDIPVEWLLEGEPWIEYRVRLDLLGQNSNDPQVRSARKTMLEDKLVRALIVELEEWPGEVLSSHKSAKQSFHRLSFLADLGIKAEDPGIGGIIDRVLEHQSEEGPFQLPMNIGQAYGGSGEDLWGWALCDVPLTTYSLVKLGLKDDPRVKASIDYLASLATDHGWSCTVCKNLGEWRGPGKKGDACPFATLIMLKLLSQLDDQREGDACRAGANVLLELWKDSYTRHPFIFYMGTDFRKLKVPFVWYDLMHVLEVLSGFPWLKKDDRLLDMLSVLKNKMDPEGKFTVESVWTTWKEWEFAQKKVPSRWLTLAAWRIIQRIEE